MKVLAVRSELCTGCGHCEETCATAWFKVQDRSKSAIRVEPPAQEGGSFQITVCTQCGECMDVCPPKALARNRAGIVRLDKGLCVGCMACVAFCNIGAMRQHPDELPPFKCVACGRCVKVCPTGALAIVEVETPAASHTEQWAERVRA